MNEKAHQSILRSPDDLRVDYALIAGSITAGLIALIYLLLI
jgi:hypothetical protein